MRSPVEVRLGTALLVGAAALFVLGGALRAATEGGAELLMVPLLQLALAIGVAGGLLTGIRMARWFGTGLALLGALVHMLLVLQPLPLWARLLSGLLAAMQIYAAVLLNTRPAAEFSGGRR